MGRFPAAEQSLISAAGKFYQLQHMMSWVQVTAVRTAVRGAGPSHLRPWLASECV